MSTRVYNTGLSGIKKLTQAQYDALTTKDVNTKYIVVDGSTVQEYLGDTPIGGGSSGGVITGSPVVRMSGVVVPISGVIAGTAEEVE